MRDSDVHATVRNYVRPTRFDEAAAGLRRNHLVVLVGPPGSGRRAGAMALLRELIRDAPLITLSPTATVEDLAGREYRDRNGYVVIDGEGFKGDREPYPDLAEVAERVRAAGTYLVVTTTAIPGQNTPIVAPYLTWERPPVAEVLRGHLAGRWPKDDLDRLVDTLTANLPANYTLRWLACLARRVIARKDPEQALKDMDELCGRQVDRWFDRGRSWREVAEVTAAAFLAGAPERTFRSQRTRLEQILIDRRGGRRGLDGLADEPAETPAPGEGLVRLVEVWSGTARVVAFREHTYQRLVVGRLWRTSETWFLNAVREWINGLVGESERLEVATGLALLARTDAADVEASFLDPWALGRLGWPGKLAAAYVLWCMCREEKTAPLALRTGISWVNSGDVNQRATAAMAFGGELGVAYPTDAARRLWQLMTQADDLCQVGRTALGRLFAILADQTTEAGEVITMLETQRGRFCQVEGTSRMRDLTIGAILAIVTARSHRTDWPAVADFLHAEPDRIDEVARLWATLIRHQPARLASLIALWHTLHALRNYSEEGVSRAWALGRALAEAMHDDERAALREDLARIDKELRLGDGQPPADVLMACIEALVVPDDEPDA
jgi:hypothetical protein